ncbi:cyclase family protein [Streptomyces malaysiensis]|uniref:Cyclase family protein n=1 Tax=Streptomyces malaysiensis subsp. samsunensis TaxID=459658 RepID=A0A9X2LYV8_STRMQ|nr:cyclase family protein [Streptomyces samsunensis]MCQ8832222.1 cyclase family protein [Streptomyces samsunensis]
MSSARVIDLTHPIPSGTAGYPGDPGLVTRQAHTHDEQGYLVTEITTGSHVGTHIDAPLHVFPGGADVAALDLDVLVGPADVIDVGVLPVGAAIPVEPVVPHLRRGARLLIKTDWAAHFGSDRYHDGFPTVSLELASAAAEAGVAVLGLEQPSLCDGPAGLEAHHILLGAGCLIIEGLRLTEVEAGRYEFACLPLPIEGVDGSPVRAIAWPQVHTSYGRKDAR